MNPLIHVESVTNLVVFLLKKNLNTQVITIKKQNVVKLMTSSNSTHNIARMPNSSSYVTRGMTVMTTQRVKSLKEMDVISPIDKGASVCDCDCICTYNACIAFCICMCVDLSVMWCCSCVKRDVWFTPVRSTLLNDVMITQKPKGNDNKARRDDVFWAIVIKYANIRSSNLQIRWLTNHAQFQAKQRHDTRTKHATTAARQLVAAVTSMYVQNT